MKRFALLITALLLCGIAAAHTINWHVDGILYQNTTCEIGNDVILPNTPTKRGHVFRGWVAEHFDRGTYTHYDAVPSVASSYARDTYGNYTPLVGDYITIETVYDCQSNISLKARYENNITYLDVLYQDYTYSYNMNYYSNSGSRLFIAGNNLSVYRDNISWVYHVYAETDGIMYNGNNYSSTDLFLEFSYRDGSTKNVFINCQNSGAWRFKYDGVWENDGKNGWKPDQQIVSE